MAAASMALSPAMSAASAFLRVLPAVKKPVAAACLASLPASSTLPASIPETRVAELMASSPAIAAASDLRSVSSAAWKAAPAVLLALLPASSALLAVSGVRCFSNTAWVVPATLALSSASFPAAIAFSTDSSTAFLADTASSSAREADSSAD